MAMYYFSGVVRYRPFAFVNGLHSNTEQGWLAKAFIEQSPPTFIYRMMNMLLPEDIIIAKR